MNEIVNKNKINGFTVVELMIVVAIIAIAASIAFPSYDRFIRNSSVQREAHLFENALEIAKFNARNSGREIKICGTSEINDEKMSCLSSIELGKFNQDGSDRKGLGWVVFRDSNDDNIVDSDEKIFKKVPFTSSNVRMKWNGEAIITISPRNQTGGSGTMCVYSPKSDVVFSGCNNTGKITSELLEKRVVLSALGNVTYKK